MDSMRGLPCEPVLGKNSLAIPTHIDAEPIRRTAVEVPPTRSEEEREPAVKRAYFTREEVRAAGFTTACPGCIAIQTNKRAQGHTEECRRTV